jgi:hypothetical protein
MLYNTPFSQSLETWCVVILGVARDGGADREKAFGVEFWRSPTPSLHPHRQLHDQASDRLRTTRILVAASTLLSSVSCRTRGHGTGAQNAPWLGAQPACLAPPAAAMASSYIPRDPARLVDGSSFLETLLTSSERATWDCYSRSDFCPSEPRLPLRDIQRFWSPKPRPTTSSALAASYYPPKSRKDYERTSHRS